MEGKKEKRKFEERIIDEEKLKAIAVENPKVPGRLAGHTIACFMFWFGAGGFMTFVGYNFSNAFAITFFCMILLYYAIGAICFMRVIFLERKYRVFRKPYYPALFLLPILLMAIAFSIAANFTTTFTDYGNYFTVHIVPWYFLGIYVPWFFISVIYLYYSFYRVLGRNSIAYKRAQAQKGQGYFYDKKIEGLYGNPPGVGEDGEGDPLS